MAENDSRNGDRSTPFASFAGDLEVDQPVSSVFTPTSGAKPASTSPASAPMAQIGRATASQMAGTAVRSADSPSTVNRGGRVLFVGVLAMVVLIAGVGYRIYCGYRVAELRYAFGLHAQDLRQELIRLAGPVGPNDVRAAVERFAADTGVEIEQLMPSLEPLTDANVGKLPRPVRLALGVVSKLPHHRLPYAVVGFTATMLAHYGIVKEHFEARHYTWIDLPSDSVPAAAPSTHPGSAIGRELEQQMKRRLERALGPDAL